MTASRSGIRSLKTDFDFSQTDAVIESIFLRDSGHVFAFFAWRSLVAQPISVRVTTLSGYTTSHSLQLRRYLAGTSNQVVEGSWTIDRTSTAATVGAVSVNMEAGDLIVFEQDPSGSARSGYEGNFGVEILVTSRLLGYTAP